MLEDELAEQPRPSSLARAIRETYPRFADEVVLFIMVNLGWALAVAVFAFVRIGIPIAILFAPVLALPTAVLMRLAVVAARDRSPTWSMARDELGRLTGRKLVLAALQLLLIGLAVTNIVLGGSIGGIGGVLSTLVGAYAFVLATVYAIALWPIVCDPARAGPVREQLRLALGVVVLRPLQLGVLAVLTALAVVVSVQLIVPMIFVPSFVLIAIAGYVVPAADEIRPIER